MTKSLAILLLVSLSVSAFAQENTKQKEAGLTFNNFDSFGLTYRTGTNKSLWRINTLFISGNNNSQTNNDDSSDWRSSGFGIKFGKEFRTLLDEKLEFRYGVDLSFDFVQSKRESFESDANNLERTIKSTSYSPGINAIIGLNYITKSNIIIGAEILPHFTYHNTDRTEKITTDLNNVEDNAESTGFSYGLSNSAAMISIIYRF